MLFRPAHLALGPRRTRSRLPRGGEALIICGAGPIDSAGRPNPTPREATTTTKTELMRSVNAAIDKRASEIIGLGETIEFLGGKPEMLRLGRLDDVDMAMMIHAPPRTEEDALGQLLKPAACSRPPGPSPRSARPRASPR